MATFRLSNDTIERLTAKFKAFQEDREIVRSLLDDYVADYRRFTGTELARQEYLREKYARRAPRLSHLVWDDDDGSPLWGVADIAIVLGRDRSSLSRTLVKMQETDGWSARLVALRKLVGKSEVAPVYAYRKGIFDLVIDYYEEDYLLRFTKPRRGAPRAAEDEEEIRRFWNYLKMAERSHQEQCVRESEPVELPDIPPMSLREALRLIFNKMFTIRAGALFTALFALFYELSGHWPGVYLGLPVVGVITFFLCILLLRRGKYDHSFIATLGAGTLIFSMLWLAGFLSREGLVHIPGGRTIWPPGTAQKPDLVLDPFVGSNDGFVTFQISTPGTSSVKQFYYRIKPDTHYHPTGPRSASAAHTDLKLLNSSIPAGLSEGVIQLDVKYIDIHDMEYGPYSFEFDLSKVRLDAFKKLLLESGDPWVVFSQMPGGKSAYVQLLPSIRRSGSVLRYAVTEIRYGVNKKKPDMNIPPEKAEERYSKGESLLKTDDDSIEYVSSQLLFRDGALSDVRIFAKKERS